jgi:acyl-homoserine lactone acylase PvdQ
MAMNWLKGLVAPPAQFPGQPQQGGAPQPMPQGGPPIGGSPYGVQPAMGAPQVAPMPEPAPAYVPPQWSTGTRTQGEAQGLSKAGDHASEARVAQLQHDVESLALFARTLLTLLEQKNVVTRAEFEETKKRLDMLDGKLDDR